MAKGNTVVPVRIPDWLLTEMDTYIIKSWATRPDQPLLRSSFIRKAIQEKLAHLQRSRRKKKPATVDIDKTGNA